MMNENINSNEINEYQPSIIRYKALTWISIVLFGSMAAFCILKSEIFVFTFSLFFVLGGIYLLSIATRLKINQEGIRVFSIFGKYRMLWSDVERVEVGNSFYVFFGKAKKGLSFQCIGLG